MKTGIQKYLDSAVEVLDRFGILQKETTESKLATILLEVSSIDPTKVMAISRVVQYQGSFNQLVRDNIESTEISQDYQQITEMFDSIRDDSRNLVKQMDDGKITTSEKIKNAWMKLVRGTPHVRFEKINELYHGVAEKTQEQLIRENNIIEGYLDFRFALKESEIIAHEVLQIQQRKLGESNAAFIQSIDALKKYSGEDNAQRSRMQLTRDEMERAFNAEDRRYQLIKDVAENLTLSYNVGETLMAKLRQTHDLKDRVYRQAVTSFTTIENVFTTMDAIYTTQYGLHDQTQTLEAMKTGMNKSIEDIAEFGTKLETAALKAGYGPTINASSVQKLVDAIVTFQEESRRKIDEYRSESTRNYKEVARIVDEGKDRVGRALENYAQQKQLTV